MKSKYLVILITSLLLTYLVSCKQASYKNKDLLESLTKKVDEIEIFYYGKTDTLKNFIIDKGQIKIITDLINGKIENEIKECNPDGHILYFQKNKIIFETTFSNGNNCKQLNYFISHQHYNTKLTYRAGMLLNEYSYGKN